jgi:integrase
LPLSVFFEKCAAENEVYDVARAFEEAARAGAVAHMGEESKGGDGTLHAIGADEVLSAVELAKLIEAAQPGLEKVMLVIFTGLRPGELNGLRWSCVDFNQRPRRGL